MSSRVLVVPTRHFAVTDASGRFRIEGVPAGEYPVIVWPIHGAELRGTVRVKSGKVTTVTFGVTFGDQPKHHPRKDGTPYGRYE